MGGPYTQLYVHLVWATWDRMALITPQVEAPLYAALAAKCRELGCQPLAVGGVADHVHLLVRTPATLAVATLVGQVKGASAHLLTHQVAPDAFFKWQGSYGAFTVQHEGLPTVTSYIRHQKTHHAENRLIPAWERATADPA